MIDSTFPFRVPQTGRNKSGGASRKLNRDDDTLMAQAALQNTPQHDHDPRHRGCCAHSVNGETLWTDADGVVFWAKTETLVVADLHLEKGSSFARRGQLIPPYDTQTTLRRLGKMIAKWKPRRVIALGDSFHDREASCRLGLPAREALKGFMKARDWLWITGNHDPEPPVGLGGDVMNELRENGLIFRHEPKIADALGELAGHLHPKARLIRRGRSVRRSCFAASDTRMILPSFGAYTGGLDVMHPAFDNLFQAKDFHALMRGDGQIYRIAGGDLR